MRENQLSRYGAIAKGVPMTTGKTFFLVSSSELAASTFLSLYPEDGDGVTRVYTSWAAVISAIQNYNDSASVVVSPLFTTAPTLAQIDSLNAAKVVVIQAGENLPDGSYLATKAAFAINTATTTNLFQINGRVRILDLIAEVVTTVGAATSGAKFLVTPTVGSAADICATTDIKNLAIGSQLLITGTLTDTLVTTANGAIAAQAAEVLAKAGTLSLNVTQTTTGNLRVRVHYKPIDPGAFISPL